MLDALGIKNATLEESVMFLNLRDEIIVNLKDRRGFFDQYENFPEIMEHLEKLNIDITQYKYGITTFGDTVIINFECDKESARIIDSFTMLFGFIIRYGIESKVMFRGAVAIGEYIKEENTLLGPAVGDAATWYEKAQWTGLIITPESEGVYENCKKQFDSPGPNLYPSFIKYDVPLKEDAKRTLYSFPWPSEYLDVVAEYGKRNENTFYADISKISIPENAENKRVNSIEFFKWCKKNIDYGFYRNKVFENFIKPAHEYFQKHPPE